MAILDRLAMFGNRSAEPIYRVAPIRAGGAHVGAAPSLDRDGERAQKGGELVGAELGAGGLPALGR